MARRLRIQRADSFVHLVNRGDRAEAIFADDTDRVRFLETLGEACDKTRWQVHAYVLMPNHFHLLLHVPQENLVDGMKWMLGTYTIRYNTRHRVGGHLFAGRYRSQLVSSDPAFVEAVADYIHLNPARARLLEKHQRLRDFPWSSLPCWLQLEPSPRWLSTKPQSDLESRLERLREEPEAPHLGAIRRGWCFGDATFRSGLLEGIDPGTRHAGEEIAAAAEARAEALIVQSLAELKWSESDLESRAKGDPQKLALAQRLRSESTMTLRWIAARLSMGTAGYVSHLLYWKRRGTRPPKPAGVTRQGRPDRENTGLEPALPEARYPEEGSSPFSFDTAFD